MIRKELEYNFHDSVVISCKMENVDRLNIEVMLYELFYPTKDNLKLTFSGIFNVEKVKTYMDELNRDSLEPNWNGTRINNLNFNNKKISKDLDLNLILNLDGYKPLGIHCKKLTIEKLAKNV
jgi:hypothetical protein